VKNFERDEILLPNTWIVVRIDGRGFHKSVLPISALRRSWPSFPQRSLTETTYFIPLFGVLHIHLSRSLLTPHNLTALRLSTHYSFTKPNDSRALNLMNAAASAVVSSLPDICIAYGVSDEYSFVFHKSTRLFERRAAKIVSTVVSTFTAFYVHLWGKFMEGVELEAAFLPTFDGRAVCYPSVGNLQDYLRWRQVDCKSSVYWNFGKRVCCSPSVGHVNNLYNTTFWAMIQKGGLDATAAEAELQGTVSSDKNEILFSRYGINYNNELELFKKGSVVFREYELENTEQVNGNESEQNPVLEPSTEIPEEAAVLSRTQEEKKRKARAKARVIVEHVDIHKDEFWAKRPWILSGRPGKPVLIEPRLQ
jgi:tRNA(His) guanylyltransferase